MDSVVIMKTVVKTVGVRGTHPGCGKDTVADMVRNRLAEKDISPVPSKFATALRKILFAATGITVAESETTEGKNRVLSNGKTVGQMLQILGNSMRTIFGENVFVDATMRDFGDKETVVISDVRFKNEQNAVKSRSGVIILVRSNRSINTEQMAGRSLADISEIDLDGVVPDYTIDNNGTKEELLKKVTEIIDGLF